MNSATRHLVVDQVSKQFGPVQALAEVSLSVNRGEVLGLVGENGAGKSTLVKILAGALRPDTGHLFLDGAPYQPRNPTDARRHGVAVIHQELALCPNLSVAENICMGQLPARRFGWVDYPGLTESAQTTLRRLGLANLDLRTLIEQLAPAQRQLVEIARALGSGARILLMDEPTSSLAGPEQGALLARVRQLAGEGVSIIYISHHLEEVLKVAHRVTVLRDGRVVRSAQTADLTRRDLVVAMVGRDVADQPSELPVGLPEPLLVVRNLTRRGAFADISLVIRPGEIVGLAGLVGSGRTELARALIGVDPADSGEIRLAGQHVILRSPAEALQMGIGLVPEDRRGQGAFFNLTLRENISQANLRQYSRRGWILRRRERDAALAQIRALRIRTPGTEAAMGNLSGGNQQKAIIARWLVRQPRLLILDEPTRGVDVGSKQEIHNLIREMAAAGMAVLVISSELPEVLGLSHRILVFRGGRLAGELPARASERDVMSLATGAS